MKTAVLIILVIGLGLGPNVGAATPFQPLEVAAQAPYPFDGTLPSARHRKRFQRAPKGDAQIVSHPSGCPRTQFCGCGVSVKVFGHPVRELFAAANWRHFPSTTPASGMVAWRWHHVFVIEQVLDANTVLAYDPNSGGHLTRVHPVSLRGFRVVNPYAKPSSRFSSKNTAFSLDNGG
jgi:hypothetical protein